MNYLPFWQGALLLSAAPLLHWALLRRPFAVSGRITALVDRARQVPGHSTEDSRVHVGFFVGLVLGGLGAAGASSGFASSGLLRGELFRESLGHAPALATAALFAGGMLVGFGTRMAGGCTSGHGLCGVSQLQKGSLLSTAAFFGMGIVTALGLGALT